MGHTENEQAFELSDIAGGEALVIQPGDTLIIRYVESLDEQTAEQLEAWLRARIPDTIGIAILDNCAQIAVVRP